MIIGSVAALLGGIILLSLPDDLFSFTLYGDAKLEMNMGNSGLADEINEGIKDALNHADVSIGTTRYKADTVDISTDGNQVIVSMEGDGGLITPKRVSLVTWSALVYIVIAFILMIFLGKLCKALENCRSPFEDSIIKYLQCVAWSLIPFALVDTTMKSVVASAFSSNIRLSFGVDLSMILAILLIFGLAYIFKYGAVLQAESDETL